MTSEAGGTVQIHTEDMELAGEVLQDLCAALGIAELESVAEFPQVTPEQTKKASSEEFAQVRSSTEVQMPACS